MGYINYADLCRQFTKKTIDETLRDVDVVDVADRDLLIEDFSKEVESWVKRTLTPFLDITTELTKINDERDPLLKPLIARMVGTRLMMRKVGNNGNSLLLEDLKEIKSEIHRMYKGKLPMPEIPKTTAYLSGERSTKRAIGFFDTPNY